MNRNLVLVLLLVAAVGGVAWIALGSDLFPGAGSVDRTTEVTPEAALRAGEGSTGGNPVAPSRAPVLFGRAAPDRVGTGSLVGRVLAIKTGKPVASAALLLAGTGYGGESISQRGATGAEGDLRFDAVAAGEGLTLTIEAEEIPPRVLTAIEVPSGQVTDLGTIWLGEGGALEGIVVDGAGRPVARASLSVHAGLGSMLDLMSDFMEKIGRLDEEETPLARGETGRDGRFRIEGLGPGPCALLVRAAGFVQKTEKVVVTPDGAAGGPLRIVLAPGRSVAGVVVDQDGAGIDGARIALVREQDPEAFFYGRVFGETGAGGRFRIDSLPGAGTLTAIVAARGFPTTLGKVEAGQDDARLVLHRACPLVVTVLDQGSDRPLDGAQVVVAVGAKPSLSEPETLIVGVTDRAGRALLDARPGVLQMAIVTHPDRPLGMWMGATGAMGAQLGMMEGPADPAVPEAGGQVTFRIPTAGRIVGRVVDQDGAPIAGVSLRSVGMGGAQPAVLSDAEGRYSLFTMLSGGGMGMAMIVARAPGLVQRSDSTLVSAKPDEKGEITHEVRMDRSGVVTGRVVSPEGGPLAGARVALKPAPGTGMLQMMGPLLSSAETVSLSDGTFVLDGASPGAGARVRVVLSGFVTTTSDPFAVRAGETVRAPEVRMRRGASLLVEVVTPDGRPARGARVEAELSRGPTENPMEFDLESMMSSDFDLLADEDGVARLEHLPAGKVVVTARAPGFAANRVTVDVTDEEGEEQRTRLPLRQAVVLSGRVLDPDGKPIEEARVALDSVDGAEGWTEPLRTRTDGGGAFRLEGVPLGGAILSVRASGFDRRVVPVGPDREGIEVRLARQDPDREARRRELSKEYQSVVERLASAADAAERQALSQRLQELGIEMAEIGDGEVSGFGDVKPGDVLPDGSVVESVETVEEVIEELPPGEVPPAPPAR
jgi:protocatechuate 3,4-dioxygenase beta subunit